VVATSCLLLMKSAAVWLIINSSKKIREQA